MKVSIYTRIGDYTGSIDIEYSSEIETDCIQAGKFVSCFLGNDENLECSSDIEIEAVDKESE